MRNTHHSPHFLLVEKQIGAEYIPPVLGHYKSRGFDVVHLIDIKHPTIRTLTSTGEHAKIDLTAKRSNKKTIIIVTPEITLGRSSGRGDSNMHEKKQCVSISKLAEYENKIDKISNRPVGAVICCYSKKLIENLSFSDTIHLLKLHCGIIHSDWSCQPWNQQSFMAFLTAALDEMLGNGSSYLIMRTLHCIYNVAEEGIWRDPRIFEEKIKRMLGRKSDDILDAFSRKLREEITFNNNYAHSHERWTTPI